MLSVGSRGGGGWEGGRLELPTDGGRQAGRPGLTSVDLNVAVMSPIGHCDHPLRGRIAAYYSGEPGKLSSLAADSQRGINAASFGWFSLSLSLSLSLSRS